MELTDLTDTETKVWEAAATGQLVDRRAGDSQLDSPEKWAEWGPERTVRAEVIAALLIEDSDAASTAVRGVRLQGARITGDLSLEATTLRCPLALLDCSFDSAISLNAATAVSVRLSGSHVPAVHARQLLTRGDLLFDEDFSVSGGVDLAGAHIGDTLDCTGGQFSNPDGLALSADGLAVERNMYCRDGFSATGEVRLVGAHIGVTLDCTGGQFSNPDGPALYADGLAVDGGMYCRDRFSATGEVRLVGAHIGVTLDCTGGQFSNPDGPALYADGLAVDGGMYCGDGFSATGEVRLQGTHITGVLDCRGGQFSNPGGLALYASNLTVDQDMYCGDGFSATGEVRLVGARIRGELVCSGGEFSNPDGLALYADGLAVERNMYCGDGFSATGEVRLQGAHITGALDCRGGRISNPGGLALDLEGATVNGPMFMESLRLEGTLDLTAAMASSYNDNPAFWPTKLRLDGFVYDSIEGASPKERLEWLRRNESGYSPRIYEQLAAVYRRSGNEKDVRRTLFVGQRRHYSEGSLGSKVLGLLYYVLLGYGYRAWWALGWLCGLLVLGTILFGYVYRGDLTAPDKATAPPFQPLLYTLDLLLPVAGLHQRDGWVAHGAAQWWSVFFIIIGWILGISIVLWLTGLFAGLLKRD